MKVYSNITEDLEVGTVHVGVHRDGEGHPLVVVDNIVIGTLKDTLRFLHQVENEYAGERNAIGRLDALERQNAEFDARVRKIVSRRNTDGW